MKTKLTLAAIIVGAALIALFVLSLSHRKHQETPTVAANAPSDPRAMIEAGIPTVPGAINPDVTQDNIDETICVSGWTKTIRPPASYTTKLKIETLRNFGLPGKASFYEEDHLISLEIGGHPRDPNNLWPEPWDGPHGARKKDRLENKLHKLVCSHELTLVDAQHAIASNWIEAYRKYVGALD